MSDEWVVLHSDQGFRADVDVENWPAVGGTASVTRTISGKVTGPWPAKIVSLRRAHKMRLEWRLASGEDRSIVVYIPAGSAVPAVGSTDQLVRSGSRDVPTTVTSVIDAIEAKIQYEIQSGALKSRKFFVDGRLDVYAILEGDHVQVVALRQVD